MLAPLHAGTAPFAVTIDYPFVVTIDYPFVVTTDYPFVVTTHYPFVVTTDYPFMAVTVSPFVVSIDFPFVVSLSNHHPIHHLAATSPSTSSGRTGCVQIATPCRSVRTKEVQAKSMASKIGGVAGIIAQSITNSKEP